MSIFEFVSVIISIILGLGLAQLLSAALDLLRFRGTTRFHWLPIVWAVDILWIQLEFWWNLFGIRQSTSEWTHNGFMLTVAIAMTLFAASSLVLPKRWSDPRPEAGPGARRDLAEFFLDEGKWAVGAFALFHVVAIPFNHYLYGAPYVRAFNLVILGQIVAALAVTRSTTVRSSTAWTLVFFAIQLAGMTSWLQPAFAD